MSLADAPLSAQIPSAVTPNERWDRVKHVIERLYVAENRSLADVEQIMRNEYGFDAVSVQ
jgi:Clr5 domain